SLAGIEMLINGGNAADASIATLCALTVVEPMMVSIFGCGFIVIRIGETGETFTIDNMGVAPEAASNDMYRSKSWAPGQELYETVDKKNMVGYLSIAVPGSMKAWEYAVQQYGTLTLSDVMQPAIRYAREGFKVSPYLAWCINSSVQDLSKFHASADTFLPNGRPPKPGQRMVRRDYAKTLEKIAAEGSDTLYKGDVAKAVIKDIQENGGIMTLADLARYEIKPRAPVRGTYRDQYEIITMGPPSSGPHLIQMLNMLETFDIPSFGFGTPQYIHILAEILKIVFADRQKFMGDPDTMYIPVIEIIDKRYAAERAKKINHSKAQTYAPANSKLLMNESQNTTHVCVIDEEGNIVTATQSLNHLFGSKITTPGTGMLLNNYMALFNPSPGFNNSVKGGKRVLSSNAPTIVLKNHNSFMCLGTPGGTRIFPSICQAIVNVIDFGMTLQEAVEAPRIWTMGICNTPGETLNLESSFTSRISAALRRLGHKILIVPRIGGGMNGIMLDQKTGMLRGAACWRADGVPIGLSGGLAHPKAMNENT
ncbi:MAG: gamma-glutamyltransferase, partial [Candidatus Bathyarchaeota archaeon]